MERRYIVAAPYISKNQVCVEYGQSGSGDFGLSLAWNLSERHAKELARRINELLAMPEAELCPPICHRCGVSQNAKPLVEVGLQSLPVDLGTSRYFCKTLLCGKCLEDVRMEVTRLADR